MNKESIAKRLGDERAVWNQLRYDCDGIIEASAGTGKTFALQSIVLKLLFEKRVESVENLLLVTFTEKAAGELKDRIRQVLEEAGILPSNFEEVTICTIHAFCHKLLSEYAFENGLPMSMEVGGSETELIHRAIRTTLFSEKFAAEHAPSFESEMGEMASVEALVVSAEIVLKSLIRGGQVEGKVLAEQLAQMAAAEYQRLKKEADFLTFDDLIKKTGEVIQREAAREAAGEKSALLMSIRRQYRIALVDEFQDTDANQWAIFRSIFSSRVNTLDGVDGPAPRQGFLIVVGDPKQAIYSFRGADIATYLKARKEICEGQKTQTLSKTYRSTKELVEAFNIFFGASPWFEGMGVDDEAIRYTPVEYPEGNERFAGFVNKTGRAAVTLLESLPSQPMGTSYGKNDTCIPVFAQNAAREMKRLHLLPPEDRLGYQDMCVLVYEKEHASKVREVLTREGIPCTFYKEAGVFAAEEAEMLIALFDFLASPSSQGRLAALLLTPLFNVPLAELDAQLAETDERLLQLFDTWQGLCTARRWGLLFESVMNETCLAHPHADDLSFDRRWSATRQILDALLLRVAPSALAVADFARTLRDWREADRTEKANAALRQIENESPRVQIMTMHAAKGLEFKAVFVAYGFSAKRNQTEAQEEEKRRLLYVALTRAEVLLYLPWSQWVKSKGGKALGIGSTNSPLCGGYFAQGILAYLERHPETEVVSLGPMKSAAVSAAEETPPQIPTPPRAMPTIYKIDNLMGRYVQCDSFTSLNHQAHSTQLLPEHERILDEEEEIEIDGEDAAQLRASLLPRNSTSGTVFHEIMRLMCAGDESKGRVGFAIGKIPQNEALSSDGSLLNLIRFVMRTNALGNRESAAGDSTEQTLARLVWTALNTPIKIGSRTFYLKDIPLSDRLAEVEFAIDEADVLGASHTQREAIINGSIDLLIRPDGRMGPVYLIDWKTNSLKSYSATSIASAMVHTGYPLQYELYTLAANRWLGENAIHGIAYLFVRGGEYGTQSGLYSLEMTPQLLADYRADVRRVLLGRAHAE